MGMTFGFSQRVRVMNEGQSPRYGTVTGVVVDAEGSTGLRVVCLDKAHCEYSESKEMYIRLLVTHTDNLAPVP